MDLITTKSYTISGGIQLDNVVVANVSATVHPGSNTSINISLTNKGLVMLNSKAFNEKLIEFIDELLRGD